MTPEEKAKIEEAARMKTAGCSFATIARRLEVAPETLEAWRKENPELWPDQGPIFSALPRPRQTGKQGPQGPQLRTRERIIEAARLYASDGGRTYAQVGQIMGVSPKTVEGWRANYREIWDQSITESGIVRDRIAPRVEEGIRKVTSLLAAGHTMEEAAGLAGAAFEAVRQWKRDHAELWAREEERAVQAAIAVVRKMAGTDAILADVGAYIRQAQFCDNWTRRQGVELFPVTGETTLTAFFDTWYAPVRLADASPKTLASYRSCLNRWRLLTADPPIQQITAQTLAFFRDALAKMPAKDRVGRMSPNTVRSNLRHLQTVLDKCGKPGRRNRDAAGLIEDPPWVKPPKAQWSMPKTVSEDQVNAIYRAAFFMDVPKLWPMFKPSAWWKALIVTAWSTGLRRRTLFELEWTHLDSEKRWLALPGKHLKNGRPMIVPLTEAAINHLQAIRSNRRLIFAWPCNGAMDSAIKAFYREWGRLLDFAGIPEADRFTLHSLRRTLGTRLWDTDPAAAQLMLGHSEAETTRQHYVRSPEIIARALANLPVPEAFTGA